ncbi:recombinase RecT [bacterium]|nr:recombinase RecT [bacterium]
MDIKIIKKALDGYDQAQVEVYTSYLTALASAKDKERQLKNPWMTYKKDAELITYFKKVAIDGLNFDGVHITLQSTGVSYDYIAYKNKMLLVYPETLFDVALVYKDDKFKFEKQSGRVSYTHEINNPFDQRQENIVGGYCVIKNKRGEFLTLLSAVNIAKHRKVAKTDTIWKAWFHEMCFKTLVKKACKQHFADMYQEIETLDNENYDLELPLDIDISVKAEIEKITTLDDLSRYYTDNKGKQAGVLEDFVKLLAKRKAEIVEEEKKKAEIENKKDDVDDSIRVPGQEG